MTPTHTVSEFKSVSVLLNVKLLSYHLHWF